MSTIGDIRTHRLSTIDDARSERVKSFKGFVIKCKYDSVEQY